MPAASSKDEKSLATSEVAPTVKAAAGASDGKGGYILQGVVNPHNSAITSCEFKYGLTTGYGQSIPCESDPGRGQQTGRSHRPPDRSPRRPDLPLPDRHDLTGPGPTSADESFVPTFVGPASGCENEALREENLSLALPECRAYGQVSYPIKAGSEAHTLSVAYTENGAVAYSSKTANILNSGQAATGASQYVAVRSDDGWETIPNLNGPSGSLFSGPGALGAGKPEEPMYSSDLRSSLWVVNRAGEPRAQIAAYLRGPDGRFTFIGDGGEGGREGGEAPWQGSLAGASADLSHVLFRGFNGPVLWGLGLYEFVGTGNEAPRRVDLGSGGEPVSNCFVERTSTGNALPDSISADGSVIYFTATGILEADAGCKAGDPPANEIWARVNGTTSYDASESHCTRTSGDPGGACNGPATANFQDATPDGSQVFFATTQQLVNGDTDQTDDLYVYDLPTASHPSPSLSEVTGTADEAKFENLVRVSDDGSTVYFIAQGVLATNDGVLGEAAVAGDHNLYEWRRDPGHPAGQTTFIGSLVDNDVQGQITPDDRYLILNTDTPLSVTDTDNAADVYRYDADTGEVVRVSTDISGVGGNADGFNTKIANTTAARPVTSTPRSLAAASRDGSKIVFDTDEPLSPVDRNGTQDVYLWNAGHVSLITPGAAAPSDGDAEQAPMIDGSGKNIYFNTSLALTPSDGDMEGDVYDARVGGGFSFPQSSACSGESCQSAPSGSPAGQTTVTGGPAGEGNVRPRHCHRGKRMKGSRCVKKPRKAHHKKKKSKGQAKRASHYRGSEK